MSTAAPPIDPRLGTPIKGPSAFEGGFRRFLYLTWVLAVTDFKLKFFGSVLGYLWQLMKPLMLFGVLYFVFTELVRIGAGVPYYPVVLLTGIVVYTFFGESTGGCVTCVVDRENLVRRIHFPRIVIPLAVILTAYFNFLLNFIAVVVFMLASGVDPTAGWLEFIPLALLLGLFSAGLGATLASSYVRFRDVRPIWEVIMQALFYATPILYPIEAVSDSHKRLSELMMCNPIAAVIQQMRHAMIDPSAPSAAQAIGGTVRLLIPLGIVAISCLVGLWAFDRQAPKIAEQL